MKEKFNWKVKEITLTNKVVEEYEFQALQEIANQILEGKFKLELEKEELILN